MAFRIETAALAAFSLITWAAPARPAEKEFRFEVRHDHLRKSGVGTLVADEAGIAYREEGKKGRQSSHAWQWAYQDIQQLELSPTRLRVLTYKDSKWRLGADVEQTFTTRPGGTFGKLYGFLKDRLDQRLVAEVADDGVKPLWTVPAKHLLRFGGSEGVLMVGGDRIVYRSGSRNESRTWRYGDIHNISSSGPYQLTITTYERARAHYGDLKDFNFQLKERLDEDRYNALWRRLNPVKGLEVLSLKPTLKENRP